MLLINHTCTSTPSNQLWHLLEERCRKPVFWSLLSLLYAVCAISPIIYRWRELPQVSYFCRYKHAFVETKHVSCRDKIMLAATKPLSRQNYVCRNKILLSRQQCLLRQKFCQHTFIATKDVFCRDNHVFVATKVSLSRQNDTCGSSRQR